MPADEKRPENPTTELRVRIFETPQGDLDVQWQCIVKGTQVTIPVRPSHVIGQLNAAAIIVAAKSYGIKEAFAKK